MKEDVINAAVEWWYAVSNSRFDDIDQSPQGHMTTMLATRRARISQPSEEQQKSFKQALSDILESKEGNRVVLRVDYHPEGELSEAIDQSGISANVFPWKTTMWVDFEENTVDVRHGYGAQTVRVYPAPDALKS